MSFVAQINLLMMRTFYLDTAIEQIASNNATSLLKYGSCITMQLCILLPDE